jgi:erythritol kinase
MRAKAVADVQLNREGTGYVIALPIPGIVTQVQTNMGATINIDWILEVAGYLMAEAGKTASHADLIARIDGWFAESRPGSVLYHPYISEAGERGPFVNANARAGFTGLSTRHGFPDLLRSVVEGLGLATRDCYAAMGAMPEELRVTGGATRSAALAVRSRRPSTHRSGSRAAMKRAPQASAMMAAVAVGVLSQHGRLHRRLGDAASRGRGDSGCCRGCPVRPAVFCLHGRSPGNGARLGHACRSRNVFVADRRVNQVLMQQGIEGAMT